MSEFPDGTHPCKLHFQGIPSSAIDIGRRERQLLVIVVSSSTKAAVFIFG
jgi:hypothetical protein